MPPVHRLDEGARDALKAALRQELTGRPDVSFAYLFGSVLREGVFRDVDVAVWMPPTAEPLADADLAVRLSRRTGFPVDVRRIDAAPIAFVFHALQGEPLAVNDEPLLAGVIERTARQYHDLAPLLRRATREAFAT